MARVAAGRQHGRRRVAGLVYRLRMQSAANVRTLGMVEVLFSYVVSRRVFSESLSLPEKIGMALVLLGLVLICWQIG